MATPGVFFESYRDGACCLCGAIGVLTGEHKIKASAIREEFGNARMFIGRFDGSESRSVPAQGPKSKAFHFRSQICASCNGARTQQADKEFDCFHSMAKAIIGRNEDPITIFENNRYAIGSNEYMNIFRYFAKILCCHIAELNAPRFLRLSEFALGRHSNNCVWLSVGEDWTYKQALDQIGPHQYAAHGGLVVYGDRKTGEPHAFHSTLTVGSLRYVFLSRMNWFERKAIKYFHREFFDWCRERAVEAIRSPLSEEEKLQLGLIAESSGDED